MSVYSTDEPPVCKDYTAHVPDGMQKGCQKDPCKFVSRFREKQGLVLNLAKTMTSGIAWKSFEDQTGSSAARS